MALFLITGSMVIGALAVVLAFMRILMSCCSFRLGYLSNDDVLDEGESGFFEAVLFHKRSNLGFDMLCVGGLEECDVLFCSFLANVYLYDELRLQLWLLVKGWRSLNANLGC